MKKELTERDFIVISNSLCDRINKLEKMIEENISDKILCKSLFELKNEVYELWIKVK